MRIVFAWHFQFLVVCSLGYMSCWFCSYTAPFTVGSPLQKFPRELYSRDLVLIPLTLVAFAQLTHFLSQITSS